MSIHIMQALLHDIQRTQLPRMELSLLLQRLLLVAMTSSELQDPVLASFSYAGCSQGLPWLPLQAEVVAAHAGGGEAASLATCFKTCSQVSQARHTDCTDSLIEPLLSSLGRKLSTAHKSAYTSASFALNSPWCQCTAGMHKWSDAGRAAAQAVTHSMLSSRATSQQSMLQPSGSRQLSSSSSLQMQAAPVLGGQPHINWAQQQTAQQPLEVAAGSDLQGGAAGVLGGASQDCHDLLQLLGQMQRAGVSGQANKQQVRIAALAGPWCLSLLSFSRLVANNACCGSDQDSAAPCRISTGLLQPCGGRWGRAAPPQSLLCWQHSHRPRSAATGCGSVDHPDHLRP